MARIAKIVVEISLDGEFDFIIPEEYLLAATLGSRVTVPFGRRKTRGYIIGLSDKSEFSGLKNIISVESSKSLIDEKLIKLARWISGYYCASMEQALRTMIPGAVRRHGAKHKSLLYVTLASGQECKESQQNTISPKQSSVIDLLKSCEGMFLSELTSKLDITVAPVRTLEKKGLVTIQERDIRREPWADHNIIPTIPLELMPEQADALKLIISSLPPAQCSAHQSSPKPILLHGVTGSGKTEVYLQAIDEVIARKGTAIMLVPEISLTPQTIERFIARFGNRIAILHSHLSEGERHDEWHRINDGKADIVIGARSAIFAPLKNLMLIVVDEEHEYSYKQEEAPRYNARDVAIVRANIEDCCVVLGSATPALESWHNTRTGKYIIANLPIRADNRKMPNVRIIDMRIETERTGHVSVFSHDLLEAIRLRLERAEQTIIFLNRRGFATSLICPKCGYVANCDHCSVSFTYHQNNPMLICHICGSSRKVPEKCPACQDPAFRYAGIGTQRVENIINKCFPHANVYRMDADTTTGKNSHAKILGNFRTGKIDILIGTQMIAKGLHFPNVTLVGVVYADLSLHMPDFRAGERSFQLLAQVAGRAGRGDVSGEVIVQTYTPHNPAIQAARRVDYHGFCDQELEFRKELQYPPFTHLACITLKGKSEDKVSFCASTLARMLKKKLGNTAIVSEASPAPLARAKGLFRYQVMLRAKGTTRMTHEIREILKDLKLPAGISIIADMDAISLL